MFNPCYEHCYLRYGKQYTPECDTTCHFAKQVLRNKKAKVVVEKYFYGENFYCPSCGQYLGGDYNGFENVNFCSKCGQALEF